MESTEPVRVARKRNHIWDNVFKDDEEPPQNQPRSGGGGFDDVDEDEMMYVRGASPTFNKPVAANRSPSKYPADSHRKRPRSPGEQPPAKRSKESSRFPLRESDTPGRPMYSKRSRKRRHDNSGATDIICSFFLKGKCKRGSDCTYSHLATPLRKMEVCKFFMMSICSKGERCMFMHNDFPCKFYHLGKGCAAGDKCRFSHAQLSNAKRATLLAHLESTNDDLHPKNRKQKVDNQSVEEQEEQEESGNSHEMEDDVPRLPHFYKDTQNGQTSESSHHYSESPRDMDTRSLENSWIRKTADSSPDSDSRSKPLLYNFEKQKKLFLDLQNSGNSSKDWSEGKKKKNKKKKMKAEPQGDVAENSRYSSKVKTEPAGDWDNVKVKTEPAGDWDNVKVKTEPAGDWDNVKVKTEPAGDWDNTKVKTEPLSDLVVKQEEGGVRFESLDDDNWYSSDEEDRPVQEKTEPVSNMSASLSQLLSTITRNSNGHVSSQGAPVRDPRQKTGVPEPPPKEQSPPPVIDVYGRAIFNAHGGSGKRRSSGDDYGQGPLNLPFKPAPFHAPATEIYASETSHPPIQYRMTRVSIPTPDYRHLRFKSSDPQVSSDPRLRKLYRMSTAGSAMTYPPVPPRSDPRKRNSVSSPLFAY